MAKTMSRRELDMRARVGILEQHKPITIEEEILEFYNCDGCEANCCNHDPIRMPGVRMTASEYQHVVESVDSISADTIIKNTISIKKERFGNNTYTLRLKCDKGESCPLLKYNKCSIYDNRFGICRRFPFEQKDREIAVILCHMGKRILQDYANCFTDTELSEIIKIEKTSIYLGVPIPRKSLPVFLDYLKEKKATSTPVLIENNNPK
jgi:Fe-S-cluster containining protein